MNIDESGPRGSSIRTLFMVAAKLLGLLQIYAVLSAIVQVGVAFTLLSQDSSGRSYAMAVVAFIALLLSAGVSSLLLFGTGWLADRLGLPGGVVRFDLDRLTVLQLGIQLIGVYTTSWALPALVRSFAGHRPSIFEHATPIGWRDWLPAALQLGIGLFLMLRAETVTDWITRRRNQVDEDEGDPVEDTQPSIFE